MSDIQRRETAYRLFAAEFDDATLSHQEADEERAPNYVITPTGARVNRLFAVGVLTEVESVNEDVLRGRIVDPTGAFVVYAGQYQPDEMAALEQLDTPAFVAVTGKARTFSPDDSDRVYTSVRPESITQVDAATRDRWVVDTAEQTLERVATYAAAAGLEERGDALRVALQSRGVPPGLADGIPRAMDHYGTTASYLSRLRDTALDAVRVVTGDRDEVSAVSIDPSDEGDGSVTWADLLDEDRAAFGSPLGEAELVDPASTDAEGEDGTDDGPADEEAASTDADAEAASEAGEAAEGESSAEPDEDALAESEPEPEPESVEEPETADEPAVESETVDAGAETVDAENDDSGGIGDFEPGDLGGDEDETAGDAGEAAGDAGGAADESPTAEADGSPAADDGGMYEMDETEREEIEDEFGTEFSSGNDVADPGEADIETPEPEEETGSVEEPEADESEAEADGADADSEADTDEDESAEDVDLESHLLDVMADLDDGDGADRAELVDRVASETGASEDEVEDAIQDALIGGQCYEPGDDRLKAI